MRRTSKFLAPAAALMLLAPGCGDDTESQLEPVVYSSTGVENDYESEDIVDSGQWRLLSILGAGQSELFPEEDGNREITLFQAKLELYGVTFDCLIQSDSDNNFQERDIIDPNLCFANGDLSNTLADYQG